jgi:hypothetical protein
MSLAPVLAVAQGDFSTWVAMDTSRLIGRTAESLRRGALDWTQLYTVAAASAGPVCTASGWAISSGYLLGDPAELHGAHRKQHIARCVLWDVTPYSLVLYGRSGRGLSELDFVSGILTKLL